MDRNYRYTSPFLYVQIALLVMFIFPSLNSQSQNPAFINVYNRESLSLNGDWNYIVDPYENGFYNYRYDAFDQMENPSKSAFFLNAKPIDKSELVEYDFDLSDVLNVPGDWNMQKENLFFYEGTIWYKKSFDYPQPDKGKRMFIYFGAVNYEAHVYFNGKKLGYHEGGFTPFYFEITDMLQAKDNFVVVKVDNKRKKEGVPTLNTDWWNYGGITRDVKIIETPANYISDYLFKLDRDDQNQINGFVQLNGKNIKNKTITINIAGLGIEKEITTNEKGLAVFELGKVKKLKFWSPEEPTLYKVQISSPEDKLQDQIGFRTITTEGHYILLNDKKIFLRGISIHEEQPNGGGRAYSIEHAKQLLSQAKELGCNYVRLAHYPHNEHMVRLADQMGIMVWEEIPVYWTIDWENEDTYRNAENQLTEVINRDKNRASVIIWSMANETPTSGPRNAFLTKLINHTKELDNSRLISAALEQTNYEGQANVRTIDDPMADKVDILSFNQYIGWYDGTPEKCREISWKIEQDKPVMISEFGAGAKYGYHGDSLARFTEEYQAYVYRETLDMLSNIEQLQGFSPWILVDFRSPRRQLPGIQDYFNRKGLISEQGEKKMAFEVLQEFYLQKANEK